MPVKKPLVTKVSKKATNTNDFVRAIQNKIKGGTFDSVQKEINAGRKVPKW